MAWAIVVSVVAGIAHGAETHALLLVALGWWIYWISATIARFVDPPPEKWLRSKEVSPEP